VAIWSTSDLSLAAWISHKLGEPTSIERSPFRGNWRSFIFDNPDKCRRLSIRYLSSEAHKFDATLRALRKLLAGFEWTESKNGVSYWSTNDLSLAAFSIVRGAVLESISIEGKSNGRTFNRFFFSGGSYDSFRSMWEHSEAKYFDEKVKQLKRSS
jgi:hypothetical protein